MRDRYSPYWLWFLLAVPALFMFYDAVTTTNPRIFHILVHPSGETAVRLLIVTLIATPLTQLLRGWWGPRWLLRNRRYFGVAAFAYGTLHTLFYIVDKGTLDRIVGELGQLYIWTGWLAFLLFLPLAATSMDYACRKLGRWWKPLQRWAYAAAVLTLVHWASLHGWKDVTPALLQFSPLIALSAWRLWSVATRHAARRGPKPSSGRGGSGAPKQAAGHA